MYVPIWVICLVGGWLGGLATAYALGAYLNLREKKREQIRDETPVGLMKVSDHGQN